MVELNCKKCRVSWKRCDGKEWYSYVEIRWCPHQNIWLIRHALILLSGAWPEAPQKYETDEKIRSKPKPEGYFVRPELAIGELNARISYLEDVYAENLIEQIMNGKGLLSMTDNALNALIYVSGWNRRMMPYFDWRRQRKHRVK